MSSNYACYESTYQNSEQRKVCPGIARSIAAGHQADKQRKMHEVICQCVLTRTQPRLLQLQSRELAVNTVDCCRDQEQNGAPRGSPIRCAIARGRSPNFLESRRKERCVA